MSNKKIDDLSDQLEEIEKKIDRTYEIQKQKNKEHHDSMAERQISWEQNGARDDERDL